MKKRLFIAIALVMLTACAQFLPQEEEQVTDGELRGTEGLYIAFMPNTPPPVIRDNTPDLPIMLLLENKGTSNIDGKIYLSGFDNKIIKGVAQDQQIGALPGRTPFVPRGQTAIMEFKANIEDLARFHTDRYRGILMATACYRYNTTAGADLCVDFNPFSVTQVQKVCTPQNIQLSGGQGAPIGVELIEVEPGQGITRLIIHIANMGTGEAFDPRAIEECSPYHTTGLQYSQVDYIKLADVSVSDQSIKADCQPSDLIRLTNGQGIIYCTLKYQQGFPQTAFISPLNIKLRYGYRQSISQPLDVRPSR